MVGEQWTVLWNEYAAGTYLYGAELIFISKKHVRYTNKLMPPGTVIKRWYSKTIYQFARTEPSLPMIDGEIEYCISADMDFDGGGCYLRLVFYDRYDKEISNIVVRDKQKQFRCPIQTHCYEVQLINAGTETIDFHSITIQEILDEKKQ